MRILPPRRVDRVSRALARIWPAVALSIAFLSGATAQTLPGTGPATATPAPAEVTRSGPAGRAALVYFYSPCPPGLYRLRPTITANGRELATLRCNKYFYAAAAPGTYTFCVNKKKCATLEVRTGLPYYFRVPPHTLGYGLDPIPAVTGGGDVAAMGPLDSKLLAAPEVVATDANAPPASMLTPGDVNRKGSGR